MNMSTEHAVVVSLDLTIYDIPKLVRDLREAHGQINNPALAVIADSIACQTKPPKPPEPTGLGAVVEAFCACQPDRLRFVRDHTGSEWIDKPWKSGCGHHAWDELESVARIVHEGVQP